MSIQFFAHGSPKGQPRPRAFVRGGRAAVYDPGTAEGWKSAVAMAAIDHRGAMLEGPLDLSLSFFLLRPKSHLDSKGQVRKSAPEHHIQKPDADNLAKAVMDALTDLRVWRDDSQIHLLSIGKRWTTGLSGCAVTISPAMA